MAQNTTIDTTQSVFSILPASSIKSPSSTYPPKNSPLGLGAVLTTLSTASESIAFETNPLFFFIEDYCKKEENDRQEKPKLEQQIKIINQQHLVLFQEEATLSEKYNQKAKNLSVWKTAADIASYGASAASIVVGIGFCASPVGSISLIAAGALGLTSKLMSDTGSWKWVASKLSSNSETQQKYTSYLETAATVVSLGAAVMSGFAFSGALNLTANFKPAVITSTMAALSTATSIGSNYTQASTLKVESQLKTIDQKKTVLFNDLPFLTEHIEFISNVNRSILQTLRSMLRNNFFIFN